MGEHSKAKVIEDDISRTFVKSIMKLQQSCFLFGIVLISFCVVAQAHVTDPDEQLIEESNQNGAGMTDAIKYLQELDKYYSQVARPRFGKRSRGPKAPLAWHVLMPSLYGRRK